MLPDEKKKLTDRIFRLESLLRVIWSSLDKSVHQDLEPIEVQHIGHVAEFAFQECAEIGADFGNLCKSI